MQGCVRMTSTSTPRLAGTARPTIADFYMSGSFTFLCDGVGEPALLAPFPAIHALVEKVQRLPACAAFAAAERARALAGLRICGGNYSYTANNEYDGNNLSLPYPEALAR